MGRSRRRIEASGLLLDAALRLRQVLEDTQDDELCGSDGRDATDNLMKIVRNPDHNNFSSFIEGRGDRVTVTSIIQRINLR